MKHSICLLLVLIISGKIFAQKSVLSYPFEFEKSFLQKSDYDAYFLDNQQAQSFAFILKDNKKADYVLADKNFKVISKFTKKIDETIFSHDGEKYLGGTANNNIYHYIYKVTDKKFLSTNITYMEETMDFDSKSVSSKKAFEFSKEEHLLLSFSDNNRYFSITSIKKTTDLNFYSIDANGNATTKTIHFNIPPQKEKKKNELSEYLAGLKMIKDEEEPGLESANSNAKLFSYPDKLVFTINDGDNPTQIVTVDLNTFSTQEKFIDHSSLIEKEKRGKSYVSSFLKDDKLFTLILNKKDIKIAVYKIADGSLLSNFVISEETGLTGLAEPPLAETRKGKKTSEKEIDDVRKVIKAFTKGTEGLTVSTNQAGQYILKVGTFDPIPIGGSMGYYNGGFEQGAPIATGGGPMPTYYYNPYMYYVPGSSGYTTNSARYYNTTYFKMLLDPSSLKTTKGKIPSSIGDQVKDYMNDADQKSKAIKQFAVNGNQYYGFYNKDSKVYEVDQIVIKK
jgi:hypothetical protein